MTEEEAQKLLKLYQKNKEAEALTINAIKEFERNLFTAKSIDFSKENNCSSTYKPTLPYLIISKLIDMKEKLIKNIYFNALLLDNLEKIIYEIGTENINCGILLSNKYILGLSNLQLEMKFKYSHAWITKSVKKANEIFYNKVKDIDYKSFIDKIRDDSNITREELDDFYKKYLME